MTRRAAFGYPYTVDPGIVRSSDARVMLSNNNAVYARVHDAGPVSKIGLQVAISSGNVSVAAYRNSGRGRLAVPGTRIATSGAVACPSAGYAEIALTTSTFVRDGDWLAISADNVTASFLSLLATVVSSNLGLGRQFQQSTAHPLPSTAASLTATVGQTIVLVGVA